MNYEEKLKELDLKKGDYVRVNETFRIEEGISCHFGKDEIYQATRKDNLLILNGYQIKQKDIFKIDKVHIVEDCSNQELKDVVKKRKKKNFLDAVNHKGCILFDNNEYYEIIDIKEVDNGYSVSYLYLYKPTNIIEVVYDQSWDEDDFNYIELIDKSIIDVYKELKGE